MSTYEERAQIAETQLAVCRAELSELRAKIDALEPVAVVAATPLKCEACLFTPLPHNTLLYSLEGIKK